MHRYHTSGMIGDIASATLLFAPRLARLGYEELHVVHLDQRLRPVKRTEVRGELPDAVSLPLRTLIRDALLLDAPALIMAHNHPGGSAAPSRADTIATRRLVEIAVPLGIRVIDHLIFAGDTVTSFRALGLL